MKFSLPQSRFFTSTSKYTAAVAGFGSGKTEVAMQRLLTSMIDYPTMDMAYLAPTYSLIRDIFYPRILDVAEQTGLDVTINEQKNFVYVHGHGKIFCRTMERPDLIVGWEVGDTLMDEWDILPVQKGINVLNKVVARSRQVFPDGKKNQIFVSTTPEGFKQTYKRFKQKPMADSRLIQMSTYSNEQNLRPGYIQELLDMYPEQLIKPYILGKFANLTSGSVYYAFDRTLLHTSYVPRPREQLHIGMDFNVYNMASIIHIIRKGRPYAVGELIGLRDTPDMVRAIKEDYPHHQIIVYPDPSGKSGSSRGASESDFTILREAGFKIKAPDAAPLIKDRVQAVNKGFESGFYQVNTRLCPQYTECLEQQIYDPNTLQPDKKNGLDHPPDAGGYFYSFLWPIQRKLFTKTVIGGN